MTISILPDGEVLLPREAAAIAAALGDASAQAFCQQAECNSVLMGKRMCG